MVQPRISIIIPTYNRAHLIGDSIKSVLNQNYPNWELIIVDDGSKDDTLSVVNPYLSDSRITFHKRPFNKPKGANACRNYGYEIAKGDYIKWLDSDDKVTKECLSIQLKNLVSNHSQVDICQSIFFNINNGVEEKNSKYWGELNQSFKLNEDLIFGKIRWQTAAGLWSKKILPQKPFDERIQNSQEWLFHIEMTANPHIKFSFTQIPLVLVRIQTGSMSDSSNKNGKYYYNASLARSIAITKLAINKISIKIRTYLLKKYFWFLLFTFYKGYPKGGLRLIFLSPKIIYKTYF